MCAQKRPLLLYVEFVRALLATRDTLVPSAMFNATGHAQQDEIMGWAWDKTTASMRTAEDIMAVALAALAGQVVHRGDKKFRKFLAGVFNDGATQDVFKALGLAAAGDQAWPEEDCDLCNVATVLSDNRRAVLLNLWHVDPALGDTVDGMSTGNMSCVDARLTKPSGAPEKARRDAPLRYRPFGPLISCLITRLCSGTAHGLFDALQPPEGFLDLTLAEQTEEVAKRLAERHKHLCSPGEKLSYHALFNVAYWDLQTAGTSTRQGVDLTAPARGNPKILGPPTFAAVDMMLAGVGTGFSAFAAHSTETARDAAYQERVAFWDQHWEAVPAMMLEAWRRHRPPQRAQRKRFFVGQTVRVLKPGPLDDEGREDAAGGSGGVDDDIDADDADGGEPASANNGGESSAGSAERESQARRQGAEGVDKWSARAAVKDEALFHFETLGWPAYAECDVLHDTDVELQRYLLSRSYRIFAACMMTHACLARLTQGGLETAVLDVLGCPVRALLGIHLPDKTLRMCHTPAPPKTPGQCRLVSDRLETLRLDGECTAHFDGPPDAHPFPADLRKWSSFIWYMFSANTTSGLLMRRMCRYATGT